MKKIISTLIVVAVVAAGITLGLIGGISLDQNQIDTLIILAIICGASALYCFVVGEISRNNSQMDKLWSILPIAYVWVIAIKGGLNARLLVMAILVTLWGIRLTINFGRKGAYSIKFWAGEEDYRWVSLRQSKFFNKKWKWAIFDLGFISIYQNALVLAICLPALAVMSSSAPFGAMDYVAAAFGFFFVIYETIADEEQMSFQTKKWKMIKEGKKLEELPEPYNKGFNTHGLWKVSRHPNYFAEQAIWVCLYLFTIGANVVHYGVFNWSIIGCLLLIILFLGSSTVSEGFSKNKYPEYSLYIKEVSKYIPFRPYRH